MTTQMITSYYEHDHDRLDGLFNDYQSSKAADLTKARERFQQFKAGLEQHIAWEEEILFPQFDQKTGMHGAGPTEIMRIEHHEIKRLLGAIADKIEHANADTDLEDGALLSILGAHNQKEENILYPAIDQMLNEQERLGVFSAMAQVDHPKGTCACGHHEASH
jgi:regulator of cell morphogenesis and NO signaling